MLAALLALAAAPYSQSSCYGGVDLAFLIDSRQYGSDGMCPQLGEVKTDVKAIIGGLTEGQTRVAIFQFTSDIIPSDTPINGQYFRREVNVQLAYTSVDPSRSANATLLEMQQAVDALSCTASGNTQGAVDMSVPFNKAIDEFASVGWDAYTAATRGIVLITDGGTQQDGSDAYDLTTSLVSGIEFIPLGLGCADPAAVAQNGADVIAA